MLLMTNKTAGFSISKQICIDAQFVLICICHMRTFQQIPRNIIREDGWADGQQEESSKIFFFFLNEIPQLTGNYNVNDLSRKKPI